VTKVAVEQGLRPFQDALKSAGFIVVEIERPEQVDRMDAHAIVISGVDNNFIGVTDAREAPVINVAGRTPEEVVTEVRRSLGPRE
jgi:predicted fused transcriptional regulator/phosphomethylpyrimidine kinase